MHIISIHLLSKGVVWCLYLRLLVKEKQSVQVRVMGVSGGIKNALLYTFCLFCGRCRTSELPNWISRNA